MSKLYMWGTIALVIILGFWRYTSVVQALGESEQANRQLEMTIEAVQVQNDQLLKQQREDSEISLDHHNKTLKIVRNEMQGQLNLLQYKVDNLKQNLKKTKTENNQLRANLIPVDMVKFSKEQTREEKSKECAETPVAEFYLKQL